MWRAGRSDIVSLPATPSNRFVKPTLQTKFHIDFDWWDRETQAFRVYLMSHLCPEHQAAFDAAAPVEMLDYVDMETGEVTPIDRLQYVLGTHCAQQTGFLTPHLPLVDAVFRVFVANGNHPLTPEELAEKIERPHHAQTILRTLAGKVVYKGLRPMME
jgi:hypothetical protein